MMREKVSNPETISPDFKTVADALEILGGKTRKNRLSRLMPFLGPAFIASVAYVDPGNFATNIQGGAQFGYMLVWVIVVSNLMAMLIQTLSAKLGIASGKNLAEQCRENFPRPVAYGMWVMMELVAMATDLAEFLGAALGFQLLLGGASFCRGRTYRHCHPVDPHPRTFRLPASGGGDLRDGRGDCSLLFA